MFSYLENFLGFVPYTIEAIDLVSQIRQFHSRSTLPCLIIPNFIHDVTDNLLARCTPTRA